MRLLVLFKRKRLRRRDEDIHTAVPQNVTQITKTDLPSMNKEKNTNYTLNTKETMFNTLQPGTRDK